MSVGWLIKHNTNQKLRVNVNVDAMENNSQQTEVAQFYQWYMPNLWFAGNLMQQAENEQEKRVNLKIV